MGSIKDPFSTSPRLGNPWNLPQASNLSTLPKDAPGYGCSRSMENPLGYPLFDGTPKMPSGFLAPYFDPAKNYTYPVICPPTDTCEATRLGGNFCMPQGRYEPLACPAGFYCPDYKTVQVW